MINFFQYCCRVTLVKANQHVYIDQIGNDRNIVKLSLISLFVGGSPGSELGEGQVRCPVCGLHLQAGDIGPHYAQEVDRLMLFFK